MGYAALLVLIAVALLLLWFFDVRPPVFTMAAAALMFGAAGYVSAGSPGLPGAPRAATENARPAMSLKGAREVLFGRFNRTEQWSILAESYASRGETRKAAGVLGSAVREHPRNFALWTLYGNALTDHGQGLNPAARLAFARAEALADGKHPGPAFFRALAQARSGDAEDAVRTWRDLLIEAPEGADYRQLIEMSIAAYGPMAEAQAGS